ncbi:metallophosphoesterase family protein [Limibacter armeniacum]|uniref:metallophosphoesterase family protein n=1 Tax=Limibacter armeniacum TaxID=466084 RepID=UPI002FE600C0
MKVAALYDIHANPFALDAVLKDVVSYGVDLILVGGDVVSGPMGKETLSLLQSFPLPKKYILGNAESEVLRCLKGEKINGLSERADEEARWVTGQLTAKQQNEIGKWPKTCELELEGIGKVLFCHGTPRSDVEVFTKLTSEEKLRSLFEFLTVPLVICGHTHMQFERKVGGVQVVNAGSVGMPFGKTGADWLLLDKGVHFMHTDYDLEYAADLIMKSDYPYAESFALNNVLKVPSEENALKMLSAMELQQQVDG